MSENLETAKKFFVACDTGQGWENCIDYCHANATFSAQAGAIADIDSLEGYVEWMKNLLIPIPDGHYRLKGFAEDEENACVLVFAIFQGTQTGPGGPVEPTGNALAADYVYAMEFEGGRIQHMTKIWNDGISLQQLGWA